MKYLVLAIVLGLAYLVWRNKRIKRAARQAAPRLQAPQEMLACATCGVHIPGGDALIHRGRSYCCADHQSQDAS